MSPMERNLAELQRLRGAIENGEPIDTKKEMELAEADDIIAEAQYTMDAVQRVKDADIRLETQIKKLVGDE